MLAEMLRIAIGGAIVVGICLYIDVRMTRAALKEREERKTERAKKAVGK
jgi:hypothetical protein